jgi:hypothetical protein
MTFASKYLKLVGILSLIGYIIGIFILFSQFFNNGDDTTRAILFFQLFFYILFGPAIGIALVAVGHLLEHQEESDAAEVFTSSNLSYKKAKKLFSDEPWTCTCGKENKGNYKVCIHCGIPRQ